MALSFWLLVLGCTLSSLAVCNAQELPAFEIPLYVRDSKHRNNFCARHEAVERGEISIRDALRGMTNISVGFVDIQLNRETGGIDPDNPDIAVEFMDELARRAGFEYRNSYGVFPPPSGNGTWTDVLEWGASVYDIMGIRFVETTDRLERGILFPAAWYNGNLILVMRAVEQEDTTVDVWALFKPFTPQAWGLIALTTVISGLVYYVLDYFDSRVKGKSMDIGLEDSLFYAAFTFNGHYTHHPKSRGTRILVFSMAFFFLLIVAAYTANLASFLVMRNRPSFVINDIQDVIRNDLKICVWRGSASDEHLQSLRINNQRIHRTENLGDEFLALQEGLCEVLLTPFGYWEEARRDMQLNPNCDLEFVGRIVEPSSASFAILDSERYCSSLLRDAIYLHMSELISSPVFGFIWEGYLDKADTSNCVDAAPGSNAEEDDGDISMGVENLSGMFLIHFIALVVALILTFVQVSCQSASRRREMVSDLKSGILEFKSLKRAASLAIRKTSVFITGVNVNDLELIEEETDHPNAEAEAVENVASVIIKVEQIAERMEQSQKLHEEEMKRMSDRMEQKEQQHLDLIEAVKEMKQASERMEEKEQQYLDLIAAMKQQLENMEERLMNRA